MKDKPTHILPKMITAMLVSVLCLLSFCLFACFEDEGEKVGPIPNGYYSYHRRDENITTFTYSASNYYLEYYFKVQGDKMTEFVSGSADYKAKIVEKEGKIYFEGYTWTDCSGRQQGNNNIYKVEYNEDTKELLWYETRRNIK